MNILYKEKRKRKSAGAPLSFHIPTGTVQWVSGSEYEQMILRSRTFITKPVPSTGCMWSHINPRNKASDNDNTRQIGEKEGQSTIKRGVVVPFPFTGSGKVLTLFVVTRLASCCLHGLSYSRSSASNSSEVRFPAKYDPEVLRFSSGSSRPPQLA